MLSQGGIVIPRLLSGEENAMHAGIEPMHGAIVWDLGPPLFLSFLAVFARFAPTEGLLNRTGLGN